jgi:flagellar motor switch protein FliN/FliY
MSSSPSSSSSSDPAARPASDRVDAKRDLTPAELVPLHDVVCRVDVVLGTSSMTVRECLHLRPQSLIRLTQSAGEDMQVIVNGVAVARGEVVIVEDSTAVRLTDVLPPPSSEGGR